MEGGEPSKGGSVRTLRVRNPSTKTIGHSVVRSSSPVFLGLGSWTFPGENAASESSRSLNSCVTAEQCTDPTSVGWVREPEVREENALKRS
jgi:hypothetical protein